jgi:hypothetical protein
LKTLNEKKVLHLGGAKKIKKYIRQKYFLFIKKIWLFYNERERKDLANICFGKLEGILARSLMMI